MPRIRRWLVAPRLGAALAGAGLLLLAGTGAAEAYIQPPPPPVSPPGGFLNVVTAQTVGPGGGTVGPVSVGNTETTVTIPPGAFPTPLQVTITAPTSVADIGNAGFCGYTAVAAVGVVIVNPATGSADYSFLTDPLIVTIKSADIKPGDIVVAWNGYKFVKLGVAEAAGEVTVKITQAGYSFFAVLAPTGNAGLDPCGTTGPTGPATGSVTRTTGGSLSAFRLNQTFLSSLFGAQPGVLASGIGVLSARYSRALAISARSLAAWHR